MKTVRMIGQVSGSRDGKPWPEPGMPAEVTEAEARALIDGGMAQEMDYKSDPVLVPPAGVHTPGRTAYGDVNLVEVPADAVADPEAAKAAAKAARDGETAKSVPAGTGIQGHDGGALSAEKIDDGLKADEETAKDLGLPSPQAKAPAGKTSSKSTSSTSSTGSTKN